MAERKTITIAVTAELIRSGKRGAGHACPIVLAFEHVVSPGWRVFVSKLRASLDSATTIGYMYVELPREVQDFIEEFDKTGRGEPFSFEASMPISALKDLC